MKSAQALAAFILLSLLSNASAEPRLQDYAQPGELDPLAEVGRVVVQSAVARQPAHGFGI